MSNELKSFEPHVIPEIEELKGRVKALEDLVQKITQAFIATPTKPAPKPTVSQQVSILQRFPEDLERQLTATLENGMWIIKPKCFLDSKVFGEVCRLVEDLDGEYVKEPKNNRWRIKA